MGNFSQNFVKAFASKPIPVKFKYEGAEFDFYLRKATVLEMETAYEKIGLTKKKDINFGDGLKLHGELIKICVVDEKGNRLINSDRDLDVMKSGLPDDVYKVLGEFIKEKCAPKKGDEGNVPSTNEESDLPSS